MNYKMKAEWNVSSRRKITHPTRMKNHTGRRKQFEKDMHHYVNKLVEDFVDSLDYNLWDKLQQFASVCKQALLLSVFLLLISVYL